MLTRQARGPRIILRQLLEPLDRPMQLQSREEEIGRRSAIITFCYRYKQMQTPVRAKRYVNQGYTGFHNAAMAPSREVG